MSTLAKPTSRRVAGMRRVSRGCVRSNWIPPTSNSSSDLRQPGSAILKPKSVFNGPSPRKKRQIQPHTTGEPLTPSRGTPNPARSSNRGGGVQQTVRERISGQNLSAHEQSVGSRNVRSWTPQLTGNLTALFFMANWTSPCEAWIMLLGLAEAGG